MFNFLKSKAELTFEHKSRTLLYLCGFQHLHYENVVGCITTFVDDLVAFKAHNPWCDLNQVLRQSVELLSQFKHLQYDQVTDLILYIESKISEA